MWEDTKFQISIKNKSIFALLLYAE
jgi:hypothetical protein